MKKEIEDQLIRLGAEKRETLAEVQGSESWPASYKELLLGWVFPEDDDYAWPPCEEGNEPDLGDESYDDVRMTIFEVMFRDEYAESFDLDGVGMIELAHSAGSYRLALRLDDPSAENPSVYVVETEEEYGVDECTSFPLSVLLKNLLTTESAESRAEELGLDLYS